MVIDSLGDLGGVLREYKAIIRARLDSQALQLSALPASTPPREMRERVEAAARHYVPMDIGPAIATLLAIPTKWTKWTKWTIGLPVPDNDQIIMMAARSAVEHALMLAIEGDGQIPWPKEDAARV